MMNWDRMVFAYFLAAIVGLVLMYCDGVKAQTQADVLNDSHSNPPGNVRPLSPRESPTPHLYNVKPPSKKPAPPATPRLVVPSVNEPMKADENGRQTN